jgi:signal transduction histidine kinase/CheY-like chemotaxis protein
MSLGEDPVHLGPAPQATLARKQHRPLFRPAQTIRSPKLALIFAAAYVALSLAAYAWTTATGGLALLWLCNGMLAGALLLLPTRSGIVVCIIGVATDFSCAVALGHTPARQAVLIAILDCFEAVAAASLTRRFGGAALDTTRMRRLIAIITRAVAPATLLAGTIGAAISVLTIGAPFGETWVAWAVGDFLGMSIALPATLLIVRFQRFGASPVGAPKLQPLLIGGPCLITFICFAQSDVHGLIMLVPMAMLFETFFASPAIVAITVILVAFISSGLTIAGYGPIAEDEVSNMGRRILALELALSTVALSAWFATAMVAERDRAQRIMERAVSFAQAARRKAAENTQAKSDFLANMSHEIRTPLNGVIALAGVLARSQLSHRQAEIVDLIRGSGETLQSLIGDILDTAKIEAGKLELESRAIDLEAEVRAAALPLQARAEEKGLDFTIEVSDAAKGRYLTDALRIRQIIANLASNAVKFTDKGYVRIVVDRRLGASLGALEQVVLEVHDTGIGFDKATEQRLFQRFAQADSSVTRTYGGAGLGLGIVKSLTALLGGEVSVISTPGVGSVFTVKLPLLRVAPDGAAPDVTAPAEELAASGPMRILVAEDNPTNQRVASLILEPFGAELYFAGNGLEAVDLYTTGSFDLVLMDMQMPQMDGLTATRRIRELEQATGRARTPIAMLSANAMEQHIRLAAVAGCDGHIAKPVTPTSLIAGLNQAITAARTPTLYEGGYDQRDEIRA